MTNIIKVPGSQWIEEAPRPFVMAFQGGCLFPAVDF